MSEHEMLGPSRGPGLTENDAHYAEEIVLRLGATKIALDNLQRQLKPLQERCSHPDLEDRNTLDGGFAEHCSVCGYEFWLMVRLEERFAV